MLLLNHVKPIHCVNFKRLTFFKENQFYLIPKVRWPNTHYMYILVTEFFQTLLFDTSLYGNKDLFKFCHLA